MAVASGATFSPGGLPIVLGLCGASNGGKTTLAERLQEQFSPVTTIHQDNWYKARELVPVSEDGKEILWDVTEAINTEGLVGCVKSIIATAGRSKGEGAAITKPHSHPGLAHLVLVEGTMLLNMRELRPLLDAAYFITLDFDTMQERRRQKDYGGLFPDSASYFQDYVWPAYMRDLKVACHAHQDGSVRMLDGARPISENLKELEERINEILQQRTAPEQ